VTHGGDQFIDPRRGDAEDDASSTKQRSLLAIAGSLLAEISLPKLLLAWIVSIVLPAVLLGLAPLIATTWVGKASARFLELTGISAAIVFIAVATIGFAGWCLLFRVAEANFWALNALAVQPGYAVCREGIRHLGQRMFKAEDPAALARWRAASCAAAGILVSAIAVLILVLVWPATQWIGATGDFAVPRR
jgi:hypothetical protein